MKTNTHKMAGTSAGNGQLLIPSLRNTSKKVTSRRKPGTADPNAVSNAGSSIYNPLTGRYIGSQYYYKLRDDENVELNLLERNSHITGWKGTLSEDEFIALPEIQMYLMGKNIKDIKTTPVDEMLLREAQDVHIPVTDSNGYDVSDHTAGIQSPVITADRDYKPGEEGYFVDDIPLEKQSGFSLYNVCVKQTNVIDKLESMVLKLEQQATKDTALMEEMYHAGRKAISKMENIIHRIGSEIGINPSPF